MKTLQYIFSSELIEAIGWTIVHSLWQGLVVLILLSVLIVLLRRNSAQLKYFISFIALFIMLGWSPYTFVQSFNYAQEKSILKENITSNPGYIKALLKQNTIDQTQVGAEKNGEINIQLIKIKSFFQRNFNQICTLWLIGMFILLIRLIGGLIYAHRIKTYQLMELNVNWINIIEQFTTKLNINRKVKAFFSPLASVPMTLGAIKPLILFPASAFSGLPTKDIEAIIAHELAHVYRHDYFFNIVQSMVEILFFYHPAIWIISGQIRNERENSCDNIAIELTGDKVAYVKALATVQLNQMEQGHLAMAFASSKGNLLQRIKRLQKQVAMKTNFIEGLIAAAVIVIGLTLASFTIGSEVNGQILADESLSGLNSASETNETIMVSEKKKEKKSKEEIDSIWSDTEARIEKAENLENLSEELETVIEIALSENNEDISAEIMEEINEALKDLDIDEIVKDAMKEAQAAIKDIDFDEIMEDAKADIDREEIRRDMEDARKDMAEAVREIEEAKEEMRKEMREDMEDVDELTEEAIELSIEAAVAGMDIAVAVLENLPIDAIVESALEGVEVALDAIGDIDFDKILDEIEISEDEISKKDLEKLKKQIAKEKENLEKERDKLNQEKEKYNKDLEKLNKELKETDN